MSIFIREARPADCAGIASLQNALALENYGEVIDANKGVGHILANPQIGYYIVADNGEKIIGVLRVTPWFSDWSAQFRAHVDGVFVYPAYRRQGVCRSMLDLVDTCCRRDGIPLVELYVALSNDKAAATYIDAGFTKLNSQYAWYEKGVSA